MRRYQLGLLACTLPAFVLSLALTGCGGGGDNKDKTASTDGGAAAKEKDKKTAKAEPLEGGTGVVKGKVTVAVDDNLKKILAMDNKEKMKAANLKAEDQDVCLKGDMSQQAWKVDDKGGVANVVVWLLPPQGKFFATDPNHLKLQDVVIDQPHCAFEPHVAWIMPGYRNKENKPEKTNQKLIVKNSAPIGHNTKWGDGSDTNPGDNPLLGPKSEKILEVRPSKSPIMLNCSIHTWMNGYVWAFDHPYVAVTDKEGNYKIEGVPTGTKLNIVVWHEPEEYITPKTGEEIEVKGETTKDFVIPPTKVK
jgi:hypothetical protein